MTSSSGTRYRPHHAGRIPGALSPKLEAALDECFHAGYTLSRGRRPHYTASLSIPLAATVFTHTYERRMVRRRERNEQYFPYDRRLARTVYSCLKPGK